MHRRRAAVSCLSLLVAGACGHGSPPPAPGAWPVSVVREAEHQEYERIVLVTIDTLRADHVSSYGYPRATTPFLDSLAARGVRFARAYASVSHTAPSHATMLTGLAPAVHGVLQNGGQLDPAAENLGALFGSSGFETAAFLNVKFLSGIAASFGHVEVCAVGGERGKRHMLTGADVTDAALRWLGTERTNARFLLWVHLYDPHKWKDLVLEREQTPGPLWEGTSPADFSARVLALHGLPPSEPGVPYRFDWTVEKNTRLEERELDVQTLEGFMRCVDAYDQLTLFADRQVQRLYEGLEALKLPGRTLWVVTADHGEGLASHGVAGHGSRIYQEQLHVPLVLHASDGSLAPRVVDELVAHVDLLPTLAETLGASVRGRERVYDGRSLWPLVRAAGASWPARPLFAQRRPAENANDPDQTEIYSLQSAGAKYILHEPGPDEFFDLAADPRELHDLGEGAPAAAELRATLEQRLAILRGLMRSAAGQPVPEEWMDELRDLGYVR